jgi:hypothetical protein
MLRISTLCDLQCIIIINSVAVYYLKLLLSMWWCFISLENDVTGFFMKLWEKLVFRQFEVGMPIDSYLNLSIGAWNMIFKNIAH